MFSRHFVVVTSWIDPFSGHWGRSVFPPEFRISIGTEQVSRMRAPKTAVEIESLRCVVRDVFARFPKRKMIPSKKRPRVPVAVSAFPRRGWNRSNESLQV